MATCIIAMSDNADRQPENRESPGKSGEKPGVFTVRSEDLLRGGREARIVHGDEVYRLLVTRNHKLILQK